MLATVLFLCMDRLMRASEAASSREGDSWGVLGLLFFSLALERDAMDVRATESGLCLRRRGDGDAEGVAEAMYMCWGSHSRGSWGSRGGVATRYYG